MDSISSSCIHQQTDVMELRTLWLQDDLMYIKQWEGKTTQFVENNGLSGEVAIPECIQKSKLNRRAKSALAKLES